MSLPTEEICFIRSATFCVAFVKMIDSGIASGSNLINSDKTRRYYSIFVNTMAVIARGFDAKIIKGLGDGLVCYFPKTLEPSNYSAFLDVIGYGVSAMAAHDSINTRMHEENLPTANYRISFDYCKVEVAETIASGGAEDLFGSPMNLCAKINTYAPINGMVIGYNLYHILKGQFLSSLSFNFSKYYDFKQIGDYNWKEGGNQKHISYPIYSVILNKDKSKDYLFVNRQLEKRQNNAHNIMIVDDEKDILFTYNSILSEEGYNVETFTNPHEALLHFVHVDQLV